jgi:hypothetical protein
LIALGKTGFNDYTDQLEKIRYRNGRLKGYASRLHYFSDWLCDNELKGIVRNHTAEIGGTPYQKDINFMTKHPKHYIALIDDAIYMEMLSVEKRLSGQTRYIIPKGEFWRAEPKIESGNLIGMMTNIEGLDVTHVGFAVWAGDHVRLLHASREEGSVVETEASLGDYLHGKMTMSGIVIAQLRPVEESIPSS